jgi:hypothetical protein
MPNFTTLKDVENERTYFWAGNNSFTVKKVTRIAVSERGTHRLETADGEKFIIAPGWLYMKLKMNEWTF